jgi:hypothetical protein
MIAREPLPKKTHYKEVRFWTNKEDKLLVELKKADYPWAQIASGLDRTVGACQTRYFDLHSGRTRSHGYNGAPEKQEPKEEKKEVKVKKDSPSRDTKAQSDFVGPNDFITVKDKLSGNDELLAKLIQVHGNDKINRDVDVRVNK